MARRLLKRTVERITANFLNTVDNGICYPKRNQINLRVNFLFNIDSGLGKLSRCFATILMMVGETVNVGENKPQTLLYYLLG